MARVSIIIEDAGELDGRPQVNIHLESDPPFELDDRRPALERWTSAQAAAYMALEEVVGTANTAEMIIQDSGVQP